MESLLRFPEPAVGVRAKEDSAEVDESGKSFQSRSTLMTVVQPGKLPETSELSTAARGLLLRLLERDPKIRMRNLRQLQQCAFYMGFNFEHVKAKKVTPKSVLRRCFPNGPPEPTKPTDYDSQNQAFLKFDQASVN